MYSHLEARSMFPGVAAVKCIGILLMLILPYSLYNKSQTALSKSAPKLNRIQLK